MKKFQNIIIFLLGVLQSGFCTKTCIPKIAIIGGGIGGASASHFITQQFQNDDELKIHLFEANKIGGRLATMTIDGNEYETGGSIIHSRNRLMKDFVNLLGLEEKPISSDEDKRFAFWNGNEFVFEAGDYQVVTLTKLLYRYGLEPLYLENYIETILNDFDRIYDYHNNNHSFKNLTSLLSSMNIKYPEMLLESTQKHFKNLGYSYKFIEEMLKVSLVVNYGQETDVQSFVGCVSAAGAGASLWSIKGGNKQVPELLIKNNDKVKVIPAIVDKITLNSTQYTLRYKNKDNSGNYQYDNYDIVIIATPLTTDHSMKIEFDNFEITKSFKFPGEYQTTYATFVKGTLRHSYFGDDNSVNAIFSCNPNKTIISSISKLSSVDGVKTDVWKIFSRDSLERQLIDKMFLQVDYVKEIKWKAYPKYNTRERFDNFKLHDNLYHVNAIEWAASAMEMSAIGGKNIAIQAHNDFLKECDNYYLPSHKSRKLKNYHFEL